MMKKKKIDLEKLKVNSFVTSMDSISKETIIGGMLDNEGSQRICSGSGVCVCPTMDCETQIICDLPGNNWIVTW